MKLPWFHFFTGDWLKDPALSLCTPATRGVWMDLLCAMHECGRVGELRGTTEQLARLARCQPAELAQALTELQTTGAAEVTQRNEIVTVENRRMKREQNERNGNALRQSRFKAKRSGNAEVTGHISEVRVQSTEKERPVTVPCLEQSPFDARAPIASQEGETDAGIPTLAEVLKHAQTVGVTEASARKFFDHHEGNSLWTNAHGRLINWRLKLKVWGETDRTMPKSPNASAPKPRTGPSLTEVMAYCREKWNDNPKCSHYAASFYSYWSDARRAWKRDGNTIDWQVECSKQVVRWIQQEGSK